MESFVIKLAGQYFEICPVCDYIREYCKDYKAFAQINEYFS